MKIAVNRLAGVARLGALGALLLVPVIPAALAADAVTPPPPLPSSSAAPAAMPLPTPPGAEKIAKDEEPAETKIPVSVKDVVKRLNSETANISLDDLNTAREQVAKLELLIDIEKRLKDLQTIRREREEKSLAAAIPASAFGMPRGFPTAGNANGGFVPTGAMPAPMPVMSTLEVLQVAGTNGSYTATIKDMGATRTVRVGDKLPDGRTVRTITREGIGIEQGKGERFVRVKGAELVSAMSP